MVIDITKLFSCMTLNQGSGGARKQNFLCHLSPKVIAGCGWNLACCWDLLIWSVSYSFISSEQSSRERIQLRWFRLSRSEQTKNKQTNKNPLTLACIYKPVSFKLGVMTDPTKLYSLIPVWMVMTFIIILIIMIVIITFRGAIRDFFTISSQRRELSPTRTLKWPGRNRVQITCNTSSAYHVQVSCYVPLGTKGQLSC